MTTAEYIREGNMLGELETWDGYYDSVSDWELQFEQEQYRYDDEWYLEEFDLDEYYSRHLADY